MPLIGTHANYDRPGDGPYDVDSYTKLLIHSNTTHGITTFVDSSSSTHTVTRSGDVSHSRNFRKIGASSMYFDGNGDYLAITGTLSDFAFGTGPFTIELWVRQATLAGGAYIGVNGAAGSDFWLVYDYHGAGSRYLTWYPNTVASMNVNTQARNAARWNHIAIVRTSTSSGGMKIYVDGVEQPVANNTNTDANSYGTPTDLKVASYGGSDEFELGYMDEIRISNVARWTSNFNVWPDMGH